MAFGGAFLVAMIFLTCGNIFLRQFGLPIRGTFEVMGFMGAMIFALSLGYSSEKKEHIYVSVLFHKLPLSFQRGAKLFNCFVSLIFFSLISFQLIQNGLNLKAVEELSETLRIPYYPVVLVLSLGTGYLALLFLVEFGSNLRSFFGSSPSPSTAMTSSSKSTPPVLKAISSSSTSTPSSGDHS